MQILAPLDPRVAAVRLLVHNIKIVFFEHLHGGASRLHEEVLLARSEPE